MIRQLTIRGLGLDETVDLDPTGRTEIVRPSMAGKTRVARALVLLLTGREPWGSAPSTRGNEPVDVTASTKRLVLRRRISRGAGGDLVQERWIGLDGEDQEVTPSEIAWQRALSSAPLTGPYGDPEIVRLVVWPLYWRTLAQGEGQGRPLRDALLRCLDTERAIAEIVARSPDYCEGDPTTPREAEEARRTARKRAATASGRAQEAQRSLDALAPVEAVGEDEVSRARALLVSAEAWTAYRRVLDLRRARQEWSRRRDALGERPVRPLPDAVATARETASAVSFRERNAQASLDGAVLLVQDAQRAVTAAESALETALAAPDSCPTCGRKWPASMEEKRAAARAEAEEKVTACRTRLEEAEAALVTARSDLGDVGATAKVAREEYDRLSQAAAAYGEWVERASTLGPEPVGALEVQQPAGVPPTELDLLGARNVLEAATRADGAARMREADRERQRHAVEEASVRASEAAGDADRLDRLVVAIREAPAQLLPYAVEALGDLGPVSLRAAGTGVEVLVRGHPWQEASAGELVHADLCLRAALRRAYGVRWLPIVVDQAQDWSGTWPDVPGPTVFLVTRGEP